MAKINCKDMNFDIKNISNSKINNEKCFKIHYYDMWEEEDEFVLLKTKKYSDSKCILEYFKRLKSKKDMSKNDPYLSIYY